MGQLLWEALAVEALLLVGLEDHLQVVPEVEDHLQVVPAVEDHLQVALAVEDHQ